MVHVEGNWVRFEFYRPGVSQVSVAGSFNGWKAGQVNLSCTGNGTWTAHLQLQPGRYCFRYCADGEWFADYAANGVEPGRFGLHSILVIPEHASVAAPVCQPKPKPAYYQDATGGIYAA